VEIDYSIVKDTMILRLKGELDHAVAEKFRTEVDSLLQKMAPQNLLLDMGGVSFIDSSGLGIILGRYRQLQARQGRMAITRAQPQVRRILELSGLMRVMGIYTDETRALNEL